MKNKNSIYKIVTVGLLGALVFVSNYLVWLPASARCSTT